MISQTFSRKTSAVGRWTLGSKRGEINRLGEVDVAGLQ